MKTPKEQKAKRQIEKLRKIYKQNKLSNYMKLLVIAESNLKSKDQDRQVFGQNLLRHCINYDYDYILNERPKIEQDLDKDGVELNLSCAYNDAVSSAEYRAKNTLEKYDK